MFKLNLKIALRNLWKNKGYTIVNIGGLGTALAAFILVILYVTYEKGYDKDLPAYSRIYQVGRSLPDFKTEYTPPPLASAIKAHFPEVELSGRTKNHGFEFLISSDAGRIYARKTMQIDYEAAKMFNVRPEGGLIKAIDGRVSLYLPKHFLNELFPGQKIKFPQRIFLGPKAAAQAEQVSGTIAKTDAHSNLQFDAVAIGNDIGFASEDFEDNTFKTFVQLRTGADPVALQHKIDQFYKKELIKAGVPANDRRIANRSIIFLDPLENLHLRPMAGNDAGYKVVIALFGLGMLIMIIACINFTNLSIALATRRAKEVGVKKVMGAYRSSLTFQFLLEIFMQCVVALVIGLILAEIMLPWFNNTFDTPLSIWNGPKSLLWQLPLILLLVTAISGVYPALILSGFKPAAVLKGNLQTSYKTLWFRNSLLAGQFSIAIIFITGLLIVNHQLKYMREENTGFKPEQVVYMKSIVLFNDPGTFDELRKKLVKIPGINYATVASDIPDGSKVRTNTYKIEGREAAIDFLDVDFDYFETLGIGIKEGRLFSKEFNADVKASAILNETAVARYGLTDPVGKVIRGCNTDYKIVGVVKDFKSQGFEKAVEPTIYAINNPCGGMNKYRIMLNIDQSRMSVALAALRKQWPDINKLDGDDFRYEFVDELYGRLFKKQEQLQSVFFFAAILTILIALLGLFAFSAFTTGSRLKEISIRKVLGASNLQILQLLNSFFIRIILAANIIAWPVAYLLARGWLDMFAYRIAMPLFPFAVAGFVSGILTILIVSLQVRKAVKSNPVDALKYE